MTIERGPLYTVLTGLGHSIQHHLSSLDRLLQENAASAFFLSFPLCVSRACLGKMILFSINMAHKKAAFALPRSLRQSRYLEDDRLFCELPL